jgi:ribonuclease G
MSKELFVSSTPRETKVAVVEEDQLAEVYFERENEYTLAGSIYKGRVTRVLPGMQSAFVNIGLERDAFLYVSDFFLEEEEDADLLEQVTSRVPPEVEQSDSHAESKLPIEAEDIIPPAESDESGDRPEAVAPGGNGAEEREGARRWRGRRRRGRGRERFQDRNEPAEREQRPAEPVRAAQAEIPSSHPPMVLPGESISKYHQHSGSQAPVPARTPLPQPKVRASTEYSLDSSQFSPESMVLPGESLSKYRNQTVPIRRPQESPVEVEQQAEQAPIAAQKPEPDLRPEVPEEHPTDAAPRVFLAPTDHPLRRASDAAGLQSTESRIEDRNAAAGLGGELSHQEAVSPQPEARAGESTGVAAKEVRSWHTSIPGVVEEEEIEEEESELPDFDDERLDLAEYEELEEEELAPLNDQLIAMGSELTEAVRDAHVIERATGQYEAEGLEPDEEGDEEDSTSAVGQAQGYAEGEDDEAGEDQNGVGIELVEEPEELEGARAQARVPDATAGYQQRVERKPDRRMPRRSGRRMRGRPRQHVQRQFPAISDLLKEGQEILVQIAKEPIAKKGARITSHIALPGRFLVYMPTVHHTGVSRKIASEEERHRLKRIVLSERGEAHGGFIVRTAAAGANEEDLRADIRFLINLWNEIRSRAEKSKAPALIYHDLNLVERILRDQVTTSFSSIWVDTEQEYERILRFASRFQPSLVKRVKLYTKETPLFEQFSISEEINKALKSKVWLKSGGYIVINQTEALVAIDVNTGKYVGKTARLEDTIVKTNIDAIREIVRQIRLRDLGGIIVIDFIDMDERKNRQRVMQALEDALKADRAPSKVLQFNDFGLVAITRKRVKQSLERTLSQQCPICTGTGMIKSVTTVCNEIYVEMRKMARHFDHDIMLRVHPEVAKALKANSARWLLDMEELTKQTILVKSDALLQPEQFDIQ